MCEGALRFCSVQMRLTVGFCKNPLKEVSHLLTDIRNMEQRQCTTVIESVIFQTLTKVALVNQMGHGVVKTQPAILSTVGIPGTY